MKPIVHAENSMKRFGGKAEDYLKIHDLLDSSKSTIADHRHRALTHTSWFLSEILEKIFGVTITNSDGKNVSVRDIGEQHVLEDFGGYIPTAQDYLQEMEYKEWMQRGQGGVPPSSAKLPEHTDTPKGNGVKFPSRSSMRFDDTIQMVSLQPTNISPVRMKDIANWAISD